MKLLYAFWSVFTLIPGIFFSTWLTSLSHMGFPLKDAALTYAFFVLGQAFFELPTGFMADRWGRKRITLIGILFYTAAFGGVAFASNQLTVYALLALAGFGQTLLSGAYQAWFTDIADRHQKGETHHRLFLNLDLIRRINLALGSLIGAVLIRNFPRGVWLLLCGIGIFTILIGFFTETDDAAACSPPTGPSHNNLNQILRNLQNPLLAGLLIMGLFYGIETGNRDTIMQTYIVEYLGNGNPYGMVIVQSGVAFFGIIGNRAAAYWRRKRHNKSTFSDLILVSIPLLIMGIMQALMPSATTLNQFCALYFLGMLSLGWFYPAQSALLSSLTYKENRAMIFSAAGMLESITSAIVCIYVSQRLNITNIKSFWLLGSFGLMAGLAAVCLSYFFSIQKKSIHPTALN